MIQVVLFFLLSFIVGRATLVKCKADFMPGLVPAAAFTLGSVIILLALFLLGVSSGGLTWQGALILLLLLLVPSLYILRNRVRIIISEITNPIKNRTRADWLFIAGLTILVVWLFGRALFVNHDGTIMAGDRLVWTDWPLHIGMAANFAWGNNLPPTNPTFAGIPLVYPFFADFMSGVLMKFGASIPAAFNLSAIVLTLAFFTLFIGFSQLVLAQSKILKTSKLTFLPLILSLFWGGLGFVYWLQEVFASDVTFVSRLLAPAREYTFWGEKGLWFFTFLYSEILPQRAFLFGLPIFFLVLLLLWFGWKNKNANNAILAGLLTGVLPFFHTHSFLSLLMLVGPVALISWIGSSSIRKSAEIRSRTVFWIAYATPLFFLSIFQYSIFEPTKRSIPFVFGWMKEHENFFVFWFKNTGLFWPLALLGWWKGKFGRAVLFLGIGSIVLFVVPNLFQFAAWGYDNLKIFTYWYLIGSIFVAAALGIIWNIKKAGPLVATMLFISLTLSGVIEVSRIVNTGKTQIGLWSRADQQLARSIQVKTPPRAVFLTAAIHDHPIETLAGRPIVIGFPGNMWSWGISGWDEREKDVHTMYRGGEAAKNLWKKYHVAYIIIGDRERYFEPQLDEDYIKKQTELILEEGSTRVYKTK